MRSDSLSPLLQPLSLPLPASVKLLGPPSHSALAVILPSLPPQPAPYNPVISRLHTFSALLELPPPMARPDFSPQFSSPPQSPSRQVTRDPAGLLSFSPLRNPPTSSAQDHLLLRSLPHPLHRDDSSMSLLSLPVLPDNPSPSLDHRLVPNTRSFHLTNT